MVGRVSNQNISRTYWLMLIIKMLTIIYAKPWKYILNYKWYANQQMVPWRVHSEFISFMVLYFLFTSYCVLLFCLEFNLTKLKLCICSSPAGTIFVTGFWKLLNQGLKLLLLTRILHLANGGWLSFPLLINLDVQKKWFRPAVLDICEEAPYFLFSWYL